VRAARRLKGVPFVSKLAIIGTIEVTPGHREQVLYLLMAHRARCLEDEPGTLQFVVLVPNEDNTRILLYELYQDAAAFEAHWNGPSTARIREEAGSMIVKIYGTKCALFE
jgi:(4S)-4-hydroxy-5-phosphonooxypentane-2,3-dione isomerase